MPTAVSSSSPLSPVTSGAAKPAAAVGAAGPTKSADASTDPSTETSDFNSVLTPMMKGADAGSKAAAAALPTAEATLTATATPDSGVTSVLPEGLELTAVLQQATAAKGNALPVDGKGLPASPPKAAAETLEDPTLQIPLAVAKEASEGELAVQKPATQSSKADSKKTDDELLTNLAVPTPVIAPAATTAAGTSVETAPAGEKSAKGDGSDATTDAQTAAQQVLLTGVPQTVTAQMVNASEAKSNQIENKDVESQLTATMLPSNARTFAQHADTSKSSVEALSQSSDGGKISASGSALTDLLPTPTEAGKHDDTITAGGFGKLLEAQATANTNAQQPAVDAAALNNKSLTGAVAYRMEGNTQVATTLVNQPVDSPQWSNEIGERVVWFGANKIQHAEIELDPPELGPLQVRISTVNDQTSISFTSHHAGVREVLDQSLPKLKEMFSDQGLNLVQADVGERRGSQQHQQFETGDASGTAKDNAAGDDETDGAVATKSSATTKLRLGLVDAYA